MQLPIEKIREQIQAPAKREVIRKATAYQNRIKFHSETRVNSYMSQPITDFLSWVKTLIPSDKFKIFETFFRFPIKTNEITGIIYDKLSNIFEGRNPVYNYHFKDNEVRDDWEEYRRKVLHEPDVWESKGFEYFKTEINSILIVDIPELQDKAQKYPSPYFYWLTIDKVIDYCVNKETGNMDWIIFNQPNNKIAVIDDSSYRVFEKRKDGLVTEPIIENLHDLGYCPARFFWNDSLRLDQPDIKKHPISKELEALDHYLFTHISKEHLDLYAAYPIYSGYEKDCDYHNDQTGDYCDGGFLKNKTGDYLYDANGVITKCPVCGDKRIAGAGTFVEVPIPKGDEPDLREPVSMLSADVDSLNYNVNEEKRQKNDIITACIGIDSDLVSNQAVNEKQVDANYESKTTILNRVKKGFEQAQQFVDETICRLRYGDLFVSANINYGTDFFTLSASELRERYAKSKENGSSEAELDALQKKIIETEYRNNQSQLQRMLILQDLEPYRNLTREEALTMFDKGLISDIDLKVKLNFPNFISRFENENINVQEFGSQIDYAKKIEIISNKLKEYAKD